MSEHSTKDRDRSRHTQHGALLDAEHVSSHVMLDMAQDPFMAVVYRTALVVALKEFSAACRFFGDDLAFAKYCKKEWPNKNIDRVVASIVPNRGLLTIQSQAAPRLGALWSARHTRPC